jgi:hypothetical protein
MLRYQNTATSKTESGIRYYTTTLYPDVMPRSTDYYIITVEGDRLDLIANTFYNDPALYWIILSANNIKKNSLFVAPGTQLRIPTDISEIISEFNALNSNR